MHTGRKGINLPTGLCLLSKVRNKTRQPLICLLQEQEEAGLKQEDDEEKEKEEQETADRRDHHSFIDAYLDIV